MATGIDSATNATSLPPPAEGQGVFDPCPLKLLAEHMLERRWVDIRTDEGLIARVRIVQIIVRLDGDDVTLYQEWVDGTEDEPKFQRREFMIDSDAIWRVLPTNYHIEQVRPTGTSNKLKPTPMTDEACQRVTQAVLAATMDIFSLDETRMFSSNEWNASHHRHQAIIVLYEMTDMSPTEICTRVFRYKSQGPWLTASGKLTRPKNWAGRDPRYYQNALARHEGFVRAVQEIGGRADLELRPERFRRQANFSYDYTPVIP